ncbi:MULTISPECIES: PAS domain-containing sensor histidine kinase [unclassified Prevotella]|uniref:sensor histidine kinase n=1 Tax=unclassified Prevotella TaxID=2638335 RepID=UPI000688FEE1|nr:MULTISPECIES: PAS domain-containing sensor histidine kinase [unclassified Prevotella]
MQLLIVILTLIVLITGMILNRITLFSIRRNTERAKDMAVIMQHTLNENNYVIKLSMQQRHAMNLYGNFLPPEGMNYDLSIDFIHPDDRHLYMEFMSQLVKGAKSSECMFRWDKSLDKHEHNWMYIRDIGIVEFDEADGKTPRNFYCTLYDETDKMLLEQEEHELTDRYRKLFEQSIVGQGFYDKKGCLLTANQKMREILHFQGEHDPFYFDYTLFDLPTFRNILYDKAPEDIYMCTKSMIYERNVNCYTELRVHPIYNENKELEMYTLYIRDVSQERELYLQQKKNEEQIQRTNNEIAKYENELKYLLESVDMRFFRTSFAKREVTLHKEMSVPEKTMGFDELIAHFVAGGFAEALKDPYERLKVPQSKLCQTHSLFHNSDELEWNFIDSIPYYDQDGNLVGTYGVVRDVTKLIQKQELLKQETERANQAGMRKSSFLASMSHEIRTPLNAIVGFSDVLATMSTPEERDHIIEVISNNCDMLLRLLNDILALSSVDSGDLLIRPAKTDFAKVFDNVTDSLADKVEKNPKIEFIVDNPYTSFITTLDSGRVQQVITNFVTNAIKYTHEGHIKIGYMKQTRHKQEGLYIYCQDTGDGIAKEHQAMVFDRFVKLNDFIQGTGLGLNICKVIADNCGGEIGVNSEGKGQGSTFWFWIPCQEETTM